MKLTSLFTTAIAMLLTTSANAGLLHFDGNIEFHNDVIEIAFTLDQDATNVRIWTDSFQDDTNFDPITALWHANGALIDESDDDASIDPSQTRFDSGFSLPTLAAGSYIFTMATYNNFANGSNLSDGFDFDNEAAIAISDWAQPANSSNARGTYWSIWFDGVNSAEGPTDVPEPSSLAVLLIGLMGLAARKKLKA